MKKLYFLIIFSLLLTALSVWAILANPFQVAPNSQPAPSWKPPYPHFVAGEGIITPSPDLIPLRPAESGQVVKTFVKVGDTVTSGQPLLQLNLQDLLAEKMQLEAVLETTIAEEAAAQNEFNYYKEIHQKDQGKFISEQDYTRAKNLLDVARKKVLEKNTALKAIEIRMERRTLKASFDGKLLHFSVYPGMWLRADEMPPDEIQLQPNKPLQLRVEINQFDISRFSPTSQAVAWLPNSPDQKITLRFNHIEPLVHAKTLTSGRSTELTDTKVLTLVYDVDPSSLPLFAGEQFDVFIEAGL